MEQIKAYSLKGDQAIFEVTAIPDECPVCHTSVHPKTVTAAYQVTIDGTPYLEVVFQCTKSACQALFIGRYEPLSTAAFQLLETAPRTAKRASFSDEIRKVSPTFVEVFDQASAAEDLGLAQLTGIGLRKALEFLVKDFAKHERQGEAEQIERAPLGNCIETYISDTNVRATAKRAVWLGNDEAHYVRRWEDRDISDLKKLIRLTVGWVENVLVTEDYVTKMPEPRA